MLTKTSKVILFASVFASLFAVGMAFIGTYFFANYGFFLFIITPLLSGFVSSAIIQKNLPAGNSKKVQYAIASSAIFCFLNGILLLFFGIEGLICMAMAFPIVLVCFIFGMLVALSIPFLKHVPTINLILCLLSINIFCGFAESTLLVKQEIFPVISSVIIKAKPEDVWREVIAFKPIPKPQEFIFTHGISYPISAEIKGQGVGAIRYCRFNTGDFVEPITVWDENNLLAFDVSKQPMPMKELSILDTDAPHLHDYFESHNGQFKLISLGDGSTLLEGTTWYSIKIYPNFYWRYWSDTIIHTIHFRVLNHIKLVVEKNNK